jgi:hypothetical protein
MGSNEHISKQFDVELESVRSLVLKMGGLVEEQIARALDGLQTCDLDSIEETIANDHRVNALEVEIDELCAQIIARRQPAAGDLRLIMAELQVADVRAQVSFSLFTEFESFQKFRPEASKVAALGTMLDQLVAWSRALQTVRAPLTPLAP